MSQDVGSPRGKKNLQHIADGLRGLSHTMGAFGHGWVGKDDPNTAARISEEAAQADHQRDVEMADITFENTLAMLEKNADIAAEATARELQETARMIVNIQKNGLDALDLVAAKAAMGRVDGTTAGVLLGQGVVQALRDRGIIFRGD